MAHAYTPGLKVLQHSKVRKERSFAKKELREAFPECYKILEKKG